MTIHWCGTGLSAIPGLRRLIDAGHDVRVWNRNRDKAVAAVGDITTKIDAFDFDTLSGEIQTGDLVVSMLPGDWHARLADMCINKNAHFVSSSYISPEMQDLNARALVSGVSLVNEVGLDPGIDHLMAHHLVADYRASDAYDNANDISFISYCGGIPKNPNPFRYKFSWSPLGVLKALKSPSRSIRNFAEFRASRPWDAISSYTAPLAATETFEVYPNRDSVPFIEDYQFDPDWRVQEFVRGTLRLNGWADAWANVFAEIETLSGETGDARLQEMSDTFWDENAYGDNDPDRVVMCVGFKAQKDGMPVYHKTYVMDAIGDQHSTAMARLVSIPVSLAVEAVLAGEIQAGVTPAPRDPKLVARWLDEIGKLAQHLKIVSHL